ncbi:translocation/assembly module TamB domain-containing protein [Pseudorhodoferax sp.]|uniref:translocation/assembly module TamB domain-containing protein n=1 Tax=Pseudorhodoferax sp. TaxID=1993553 RepID=UPI002DD643B1|nr:translocation/assembly module TamB domain-containing protein [Pseudorhodoferax sp.]
MEPTAPPSSPAAPPKPRRRLLRALGWGVAGLGTALVALGAYGWWWTGQPQSLPTVLSFASRYLPAGQTLQTRDAQGALRHGASIAWLRWQSPAMAIEVTDLQLRWQLRPLLSRRVQIDQFQVGKLQLTPGAPQPEKPPAEPLQQLTLPVEIELPFDVREIAYGADPAAPALTVRALAGHYRYAAGSHQLRLDGVEVADGRYQGQVALQGAAPMDLDAQLRGEVRAPMVEGSAPLTVRAEATARGPLAQPDGQLKITGQVAPVGSDEGMRATLDADIAPWQTQPVLRALADFQRIDAARFVPGAPRTDLSGALRAGPVAPATPGAATAWQAELQARNALAGPWDKQRLPLAGVQATARLDGQDWTVPQAELELGKGRIALQASYSPAPMRWQADARIERVQPGLLYSTLDATPVSGTVKADQQEAVIRFDAGLQAATARASAPAAPRLDLLQARGLFRTATRQLELDALRIDAGPARVAGQLRAQLDTRAGAGKLDLQAPGLQAQLQGDIAANRGQAQARVNLRDAASLQRWLSSLPGLEQAFAGTAVAGAAQLDLRWQGGWAQLQQQLAQPSTALPGLAVELALDAPRLDLQLPGADPAKPQSIALRDIAARLSGSPADAQLAVDGRAAMGPQQFRLHTRASGGIAGRDQWRLAVAELQASASGVPGGTEKQPWQLALQQPLSATLRRGQSPLWQLDTSASSATLRGPGPDALQLQWQPLLLAQTAGGAAPAWQVRGSGRVLGLSMAWAEALAPQMAQSGIGGDLVLDGDWNIDTTGPLRASAKLARRSGDLLVRAGEGALVRRIHTEGTGTARETTIDNGKPADAPATPAGIQRAELTVTAQGEDLRAQLFWNSARAGEAQADLRTRLAVAGGSAAWPEDAPLSGRLTARVPNVGVWSMFAPPAWRIDGALAADATLAGTRSAPQWNGTLSADGLAVRAAVEGIELKDGRMRARLQGNRLTLDELTLKGGAASRARIAGPAGNLSTVSSEAARDGGELRLSGNVQWDAAAADQSGIAMDLNAQLRSLRVLVRSDRQVTVSGQLQAGMNQGQIRVRGALTTDRGVIILPDETAPTLGSDVTVRSAAIDAEARARQAREKASADAAAAKQAKAQPAKPPDIAVSLDMGRDFAVQGHGLTTRLGGKIDITANANSGGQPRVTGEIQTVQGRYRAYGQQLDVESGLARFNGPYDNPSLDILAVRPNLEQKAGVHITGTAQAPRVALYSSPQLTDAETLSWMLLGRSTAGGGAEAAVMQQAALALLGGFGPKGGGGNFASRFGLDEIGFKGATTGEDASGSALTLGKRLTDQIYVTYEASLAGSLGTLYIFYDLTRNLALRGQAGLKSGVDLIYTLSYD